MGGLNGRHIGGGGNQIVHERRVQQLALLVVDELLVKCVADAVRHAAVNLPLDDERIDDRPAIVRHQVPLDVHHRRLRIDFDDHRVHAARRAAAIRPEVRSGLESRLGAWPNGAAQRIRLPGQFAQLDA